MIKLYYALRLTTAQLSIILVTSEGIPFKYSQSIVVDKNADTKNANSTINPNYNEAVKIAGLVSDLINYSKKTIEDLKKGNTGNICIRLRLKDGKEIIVQQEQDYYLITKQVCKSAPEEEQPKI